MSAKRVKQTHTGKNVLGKEIKGKNVKWSNSIKRFIENRKSSKVLSGRHLRTLLSWPEQKHVCKRHATLKAMMHTNQLSWKPTITNISEIGQYFDLSHYERVWGVKKSTWWGGCMYFETNIETGHSWGEKGLPKARHAFLSPARPQ